MVDFIDFFRLFDQVGGGGLKFGSQKGKIHGASVTSNIVFEILLAMLHIHPSLFAFQKKIKLGYFGFLIRNNFRQSTCSSLFVNKKYTVSQLEARSHQNECGNTGRAVTHISPFGVQRKPYTQRAPKARVFSTLRPLV